MIAGELTTINNQAQTEIRPSAWAFPSPYPRSREDTRQAIAFGLAIKVNSYACCQPCNRAYVYVLENQVLVLAVACWRSLMTRVLSWLSGHRLVVSGLAVFTIVLVLGLIVFFDPGTDRLAYASPLARAPESLKQQLRPWRAPKVDAILPRQNATDVLERAPVTIAFTTPMNKAATEAAVRFEPAVKGSFSWADERTLIFTPEEDWPSGQTVTVHVSSGVRSWLLRPKEAEFTSQFTVVGPPTVVSTTPARGAQFAAPYRDAGITMTFSRAMDEKSVTDRIVVSPPLQNQRFGWVGNKLFIYGATQPSTTYRVALLPGARDKVYGLEMKDGYDWSFTVTKMPPSLGLAELGRYGQFSAAAAKKQDVYVVNVSRVDAKLFTLDVPTYLKLRGFTYDDWRQFRSESLPFLRGWQIPVDVKADQRTQISVDLGDLGPGMYMLLLTAPEDVRDSQVVLISKTALTLKRTDRQVLAWATDMTSGLPVPGAQVTFYDGKGQTLAAGMTDGDGIVISDIPQTTGLIHALAIHDGDIAAASSDWQTGIEPWRFTNIAWQWEPASKEHNVFIYTDRPLYRPGQTVYFKGIVRTDQDGQYGQPPTGTDVYVEVSNWNNQVLYKKVLKTTAFGSISDSFVINEQASLGDYQIRVEVGKEPDEQTRWRYQYTFRVEEYRKPEYAVTVRADKPSYINGDVMNVTINASYFFGAPAPNAKVRYTVYSNDYWFSWDRNVDFDFGLGSGEYPTQPYFQGKPIVSRETTTDANGNVFLRLPADISQEDRSQLYLIEATVMDSSNQPVSGQTTAIIHRGAFYIGAQPESWVAAKGKATSFKIQTVDSAGQVASTVPLRYILNRVEWTFKPEAIPQGKEVPGKGVAGQWVEVDTLIGSGNLTTGADGSASLPFTPAQGGSYRLDLEGRDERGNRILGQAWLWVSDTAFVNWRFENNDRIELKADKRRYKPGETARILVPSPYADATALVTIERGRIISRRVMQMGNSTVLDVPVEKAYFPNVYVSVVLVPRGTSPSFKVGYAEIRVDDNEQNLTVSVSADRENYQPGDTAIYTIKTSDSSGKPVGAEVSLDVVDAALLALVQDTNRSIITAFYGRRNLSVQAGSNLAILLERVNERKDWGGGGGEPEQQVRKIFPDTAYWNPTITTNAAGTAQVKVTLPDSLTTWRAFVNGITTDTKVGTASSDVVVSKDLIVRPVLPRFLMTGDTATIGAIVHNYTGKDADVSIALAAEGVTVDSKAAGERRLRVANGASARLDWPISVGKAQSAGFLFRAATGSASDAVQIVLPVLPFGERVVDALAGQTTDTAVRTLTLPAGAMFPSLRIETSASLAAGLVESLQYLTGYPYGCVEQTMSRFLPDVLVQQTLDRLGLENKKLRADLPKQVENGLMRLYGMQHYDGGWGWWEGDQSDPRMTAYVVYGLNEAKRAGFAVDQNVLKKGALFLREPLAKTTDLNLKTYIAYVLTEYGEGDISLARSLLDRRAGLTLESLAYLAQTLKLVNSPAEARMLVNDLASRAVQTTVYAHWEEDAQTDRYMTSNGRTTAIALQALMRVDPGNSLIGKAVRWLMDSRKGGYWRTTQETAATIIALTDYLARSGELDFNYSYTLSVNGRQVKEKQVRRDNLAERETTQINDPISGNNEITLAKQGQGTLYYSAALQYYLERDVIAAGSSVDGPSVTRTYVNPDTQKPVSSVKVGDLVQVVLTVTVPGEMWYVIIEDPLPAGMEAVNQTLRTSSVKDGQTTSYWMHPEYRDEKTAFFAYTLWKGSHTYSYMVRATTSGVFRTLPAEVYPMYTPETWGRSASTVLEIGQ